MKNCVVIGGPTSKKLAKNIAKNLKVKYIPTILKTFPDGESKITIKRNMKFKMAIIVQSTHPPVDSNIIHTLSIISKAREIANKVYAVIPYIGYAKQDKEFLKGEIITLKVIANLFHSVGCSKMIVVDIHSTESLRFFQMPITNITAVELLGNYCKKLRLKEPLVISPDLFWKKKAERFANIIGANTIALNKQRDRESGRLSIVSDKIKITKKHDLIIFDDMISTGNSVMEAIQFVGRKKFRKIVVVCTHPVLVGNSERMLKKKGVSNIIGTNSIEGKFAKVDLTQIIVKSIKLAE